MIGDDNMEKESLKFGIKYECIFINNLNFRNVYFEPEKISENFIIIHIHDHETEKIISAIDLEEIKQVKITS